MRRGRAALAVLLATLPLGRARAEIAVVDGLTQEYSVEPGKTFQDALHVKNLGGSAAEVKIYPKDYLFFSDGRNIYGTPGGDPRSNAKWIELSRDFLSIPPHETVTINYTIRVPTGTHLSGTYWSILMVEEIPPPPVLNPREQKSGISISQVVRYGVQIVAHVGHAARSKVRIARKEVLHKGDLAAYELDIENRGERWIVPEVSLELFDAKGFRVGLFHGRKMRIYPGTSVRQSIELPNVASGRYKGLVVIDGGEDDVFGIRTELAL